MQFLTGAIVGRALILHGGATTGVHKPEKDQSATVALLQYCSALFDDLDSHDAVEVVVEALKLLEADPQFNAGLGGTLQRDGIVRTTAGLMNGATQTFSGVVCAEGVKHPSIIAEWLQSRRSRVVAQPGLQEIARELELSIESLVTPLAFDEWKSKNEQAAFDTVGCVARDHAGSLAAGTSTGGRTFATPGRVSDSATVAGNYASAFAAISTTGIGEEIVDDALAARIETRCRDGMSLEEACRRCFDDAVARRRSYGWIALHRDGSWVAAYTTPSMTYAVQDETGLLSRSMPISD